MASAPSKKDVDDLCLELGKAMIAFTKLEHVVTMTIAKVFGLNEVQERSLVRPMSITNKTSVLRLLAKQKVATNNRKFVLDLLKEIEGAAEKRNDLAHGLYLHKKGKVIVLAFSGAARLTGKPRPWTPKEIALFGFSLRHLGAELEHARTMFPASLRP